MSTATMALPEGTHTVILGLGDMSGIMRGKRIPASQWERTCKSGNALSMALFLMDMTHEIWESSYANVSTGYSDMHIFPMHTPVAVPWEPGVAFCFARAEGMDHKPVPLDPRQPLINQVERARKMGIEVQIGAELEFYLLDAQTRRPTFDSSYVYSMYGSALLEPILEPIRRGLEGMGLPIEQSNPENGKGQVEVNLRYCEALLAADRVVIFREMVREIAMKHGKIATFMSKPFIDDAGSGFHTHYSLWRDGKNLFSDGGKISQLGRNFVAGQRKHMSESTIVAATTPNAYRRRKPLTFCPTNNAWGYDNRTVALRVIEGDESAVRVEKRDGSAECNPYYLFATEIAAGLDGIEAQLDPGPATLGSAYESTTAEPLICDISTAIETARGSAFLKRVLGELHLDVILAQSERERDYVANQVTAVELSRYMGNM